MIYLLAVSLIWSFSFGLIKHNLAGVDSNFVAWARMFLALPVFLPLLRLGGISSAHRLRLMVIGAVQYGLMYMTYLYAFRFLEAYEVALFSILTPIFVTLINDLYQRRVQGFYLTMAVMAVLGAVVIRYEGGSFEGVLAGFVFMQLSNICFAFGQIEYRRLRRENPEWKDRQIYALLYLGAFVVTTISATISGGWASAAELSMRQILVLIYLGVVASGLGFFLWNKGAVTTNPGTLAVFNNLKIPIAILVSLVMFGEQTDIPRLLIGGGVMVLAVVLAERKQRASDDE